MLDVAEYIDALTNLCVAGHARFALAHANALVAINPLLGQLGRATVAATTGDLAAQRAAVEAAAKLAPTHPSVLQARAVLAALSGDAAAAVQAARRVVAAEASPRALNGLAKVLLATGQRDEALSTLRALVGAHSDVDAHLQLAAIASDDGTALHHLVEAFLASPTDDRPMQSLMQRMRDTSWPIGVAMVTRHLRAQPIDHGLRYVLDLLGLGALEYLRNSPWAALVETPAAVYANAMQSAREVPVSAQLVLAGLLIDSGRLDDARGLLTSIGAEIANAGIQARCLFLEARLATAEGDDARALDHLYAAQKADPGNVDVANDLIDLLLGKGDRESFAAIEGVLAGVPEITRRLNIGLTLNEALWCEAHGDRARALELVEFLAQAPLGRFQSAVGAMRVRLKA